MDHSHHHHHHHKGHGQQAAKIKTTTTATMSTTISDVISEVVTSVMSHDHHDMHGSHEAHVVYDTHPTAGTHDIHSEHDARAGHGGHSASGAHAGHGTHESHHHAAFFTNEFGMSVLLEDWYIDTTTGILLLLAFTAVLSIGYQGIKWVRKYLHTHYRDRIHSWRSKEHVVQTMLYSTEFCVSYILMLVVMTYNTWILLVTLAGLGLGYFLFGLHQGREKSADRAVCPRMSVDDRNKIYDKNPSAQELVPLGGTNNCEGCCDLETVRETDILT